MLLAAPALAQAAEAQVRIDIPAGPLSRSLTTLSLQTGLSIGAEGPLPPVNAPAVRGLLSPQAALARLLAGTGLRAVRIGPLAFRLVTAPAPPRPAHLAPARPRPKAPAAMPPPARQAEIVVTGFRRPQPLFTAPASMALMRGDIAIAGTAAAGSRDVAARIDGLTLTNLGEGRNRQFIRGVADSAFNGYSQSTVAIVVDGARVTYDAPDPDLRLVDIDRVEVLKGPQGPLYGSGALGGVYHLVTNRPNPSAATAVGEVYGSGLAGGSLGGGGSLTVNLPLARDRLAVRASAYAGVEPGWIDTAGRRSDGNDSKVSGGRVALRWMPAAGWTVDLGAMAQFITSDDSQYVPARAEAYRRPAQLREPHDNDFRMVSAGLGGSLGGMRLEATASVVQHEVTSRLDASAAAAAFGETAPLAFDDDRKYSVIDGEARLSGGSAAGLAWIAGLSYLSAKTNIEGMIAASSGDRQVVSLSRRATEAAAYGQASLSLAPRLRAELGMRLFRATSADELEETDGSTGAGRLTEQKTRFSPSLALAWSAAKGRFVFARIARAERAAGLGAEVSGAPTRFASDHLTSFELGGRLREGVFSLEAAVFHSAWRNMQSDYLLADGLIATHNAGDAAIWGAEASARLAFAPGWNLEAGGVVQNARLVHGSDGSELPDDKRLPVVPNLAGRLNLARTIRIGAWKGAVTTLLRFNGSQRLSFDPGLDRRSNGFAVLDASGQLARGPWTVTISLSNLLGARADTFGFGNPFSIRQLPQYTPLRPRGASLSLRRSF